MKAFFSVFFVWMACFANAQEEDLVSLQSRLQSNIFLKAEASSTDVFVGEPITVTYKLYTALPSESRVVKRPVFSGFTVKDISNEAPDIPARDNIDGVIFDVHTILKLQLTPLRAGQFSPGSLNVQNRVKLEDANGNRDPILNGVAENYTLNNGYYTLTISSDPLKIMVTALPDQNSHPDFKGTIGSFKMDVKASKSVYAINEQGELEITLTGVGEFSQIALPEINWPEGIEVFPVKTDEEKPAEPGGTGYKSFTIPFKANRPGKYIIPPVRFSFFDAATNSYKTITNIPVELDVIQEGLASRTETDLVQNKRKTNGTLWTVLLLVIALSLTGWLIIRLRKKAIRPQKPPAGEPVRPRVAKASTQKLNIDDLLQPAALSTGDTGNGFYTALKKGLAGYFEIRYALPAASFNSETAEQSLKNNGISELKQAEILQLISEIDTHIYSGGGLDADKALLLNRTKKMLAEI